MLNDVQEKFKELRLKRCSENIEILLEQEKEKNLSTLQVIDRLLAIEIEQRHRAKIKRLFGQSKLLEQPTIDQFDFSFHGSRKKQKNIILNLLDLDFIKQKKDIIFIGNPGVGKSMLAKTIAYAATQAGIKTLFTSAMDMINQLNEAQDNHSLIKKLKMYQSPDLLICDELCKALHNSSYVKLNIM